MEWLEVTVVTSRELADVVSLRLIELGSEGTVIKDSEDIKELLKSGIIWDYVDEHLLTKTDPRVFVSGFFGTDINIETINSGLAGISIEKNNSGLAGILADESSSNIEGSEADFLDTATSASYDKNSLSCNFEITVRKINSSDWENEWKKYYMPIEFSSFAIVPAWIKNHDIKNKKIIFLNPGMAFGTGSHETTSMCLKFMDEIDFSDKVVIDLGCGSGILGLTAASLGAKEVILTDIDPYAIKCANENAQLNNLYENIKTLEADLFKSDINKKADILTANLTAPLLLLAKYGIKRHLKKDGQLIISGILKQYNKEVLDAFSKDFRLDKSWTEGEWCAHKLSLLD